MEQGISRQIYLAERQGLTPVSPDLRQGGFWPLFSIFCNSLLNPATLVTSGMMVIAGLSLGAIVLVQTLSVTLGMLPFLVLAKVGIRNGIPGQIFCRAVFGHNGSRWLTSPLRILCSVYWYAFQTIAAMMATEAILSQSFNITVSLGWLAAGFAILQGGVALLGYGGVTRLSSITLPLKVITFIILLIWLVVNGGEKSSFDSVVSYQVDGWEWSIALAWGNGIFSSMLTLMTDAADFSRYTRKPWHMHLGILGGVLVGTAIGALFGGWCVIAGGGENINPFAAIVALSPGLGILLLIVIVTVLDAWTINVINLYTGGFSLANSFEYLGRLKATGIIVVAGSVLSLMPDIVYRYVDALSAVGALFGPVAGVLLAWCWCHKERVDIPSLYDASGQYWYWRGWNLFACIPIGPAFVLALCCPATYLPTLWSFFFCLFSYRIATLYCR